MKNLLKRIIGSFLALTMLLCMVPAGAFAIGEDTTVEVSSEVMYTIGGRTLLYTYEQVQDAAKAGGMYALANDVIRNDSRNYDQIVVDNNKTFDLDLNGYVLERTAMSVDESLIHVKSGYLVISDSSAEQTGACIYEPTNHGSFFAVIYNSGGDVDIYGGTFILKKEYSEYDSGVLYSEGGVCNIYGGKFDATEGSGGAAVYLYQLNYINAAPRCNIYDGEFYAKYIVLGIGALGKYVSNGAMYSSIYVFGGKFVATMAASDEGGYAYANNGWGKIITVQGDIYYKSPNARDQKYANGATTKLYKDNGIDMNHVYAPAFITDSDDFYETMRFEHLALYRDLEEYTESNFPTIYDLCGEEIEATLAYIPEIVVREREMFMPYLSTYSNPMVENVKWYMATEYNGESTKWYNMNVGGENGLSQWRFAERSENGGEIYVRADVTYTNGNTYTDLVKLVVKPLSKEISGQVEIVNNAEYGNILTAVVNNAPSAQKEGDYSYKWVVNDKVVGNEKTFAISETSYIGAKIYCSVSCNGFEGSIISPTLTVAKATNNNYPTTGYVSYKDKTITITAMEFEQEYLITAKSNSDSLTKDDWKKAFTPMSDSGAFTLDYWGLNEYEGKTIYVYSRFKETSTTQTGNLITCTALMLSDQVSLTTLDFKDIVNKTIYIPFTYEGATVDIKYDLNPINANKWNSFSWRTSYPLSIVSPTDKVNPENNTGVVTLKITKTGGAQLVASYFGQAEVIYASANIVVYDSENPNVYAANVAYPLEDKSIKVGTTYTCQLPVIVPAPADNTKFSWYFTKSTQQGRVKLEECECAVIDNKTGLIRGIAAGEVYVTLYYGESELDTFRLSVVANDEWVSVNEIRLSQNTLDLKVGDRASLSASVYPVNATDKSVSWSSSAPLVASVDANGNIKALSEGTAVITAKCGNVSATRTVTVKANPLYSGTGDEAFVLGDINKNNNIDSMDYVLLKRAYFGTYKLENIAVGDINKNGSIDSMDYVYLRRAYFGTYVIK